MAATDQATGSSTGTIIDQSHPGSTVHSKEQTSAKHLAAAAAHEQVAMYHKAAANAQQSEHAKAAEKASSIACEKSSSALMSTIEK